MYGFVLKQQRVVLCSKYAEEKLQEIVRRGRIGKGFSAIAFSDDYDEKSALTESIFP